MKKTNKDTQIINDIRSTLRKYPSRPPRLAIYIKDYTALLQLKKKLEDARRDVSTVYPGLVIGKNEIILDGVELYAYEGAK